MQYGIVNAQKGWGYVPDHSREKRKMWCLWLGEAFPAGCFFDVSSPVRSVTTQPNMPLVILAAQACDP